MQSSVLTLTCPDIQCGWNASNGSWRRHSSVVPHQLHNGFMSSRHEKSKGYFSSMVQSYEKDLGRPKRLGVSLYWRSKFSGWQLYLWVASTTTPDLLVLTRDHGLPLKAILAFVFLGGLAVSAWFFLNFARRCNELLYERNFN